MKVRQSQSWAVLLMVSLSTLTLGCSRAPLLLSTDNSSLDTGGRVVPPPSTGTMPVTYCSGNSALTNTLSADAIIYLDNYSRYVEDHMRVRIKSLPSNFGDTDVKLKFFRWKASDSGTIFMDDTPLIFGVESSYGYTSGGERTQITAQEMQTIANADLGTFLSRYQFIVRGTTLDWEALMVVVYKGEQVLSKVDVLLPPFNPNPVTYRSKNVAVLSELHPNRMVSGTGWSDNDYRSMLSKHCFYNVSH